MTTERTSMVLMMRTCLGLILSVLSGCDYWPPALQTEIDTLRAELNDVLDDRQRLEFEKSGLKATQESLQREVETKAQENDDLRRRLAALTIASTSSVAATRAPLPSTSSRVSHLSVSRHSSASPLLRPSARGPRVVSVQRLLQHHGFPVRRDSIYGRNTVAAVRSFQRVHGLPADGIVDVATLEALRRIERTPGLVRQLWLQRPPLTGRDVRYVQEVLRRAGYRVRVDGRYGSETDIAMTRFQQKHGLEPDGVVGPKSWRALTQTR